MKQILLLATLLLSGTASHAQTVFWVEDFDSGANTRWNVTGNDPTPAGIPGLVYGTNGAGTFDYFIINDANTPELDGTIAAGQRIDQVGQFVRGHHYDCAAPSNLPNPFANTGAVNNSLHITSQAGCAGLIYAGTPGYDDWNCITIAGNDFVMTQTEQFAAYNSNIDATGKCNIKLTADFFLGGSANGLEAHSTILYSVDGGLTWAIVQDNLSSCLHTFAGTCNNWQRRTFELPADANNQPDLRIAFRWTEDGNTNNNTQDYALGASFNVDNVMLSACDAPTVKFSADMTNACKNQTVSLTSVILTTNSLYSNCFSVLPENCAVTSYSWVITGPGAPVFVNGTNANSANPQVQFTVNGTYNVALTAATCGGGTTTTRNNYLTINNCPPEANFFADKLTACTEPAGKIDTVFFTNLSTSVNAPIASYTWTFTPNTVTFLGGTTASSVNPMVRFNTPGIYEVSLQATSAEGSDTETKTAYINAISCECASSGGGGPVTVFSENFDGNGGAGSRWAVLNENIGAQGAIANQWWISDEENGNAAGACGTAGGGDATLHVSACSCYVGDLGAAYEAGAGFCSFIPSLCPITNKRTYSVAINTTGMTGMTLSFVYMENGQTTFDDATVIYSINNGSTWLTLSNPAKTAVCGSGQGLWTAYSIALPATCENITGLRIGFTWRNNDGTGTDPSFAVDDITITTAGGGGGSSVTWNGTTSNNWHTASNWSSGAVPTNTTDVRVPSPADLTGSFMPTISAAAVAKNVCNYGTITLTGDNTLTIEEELLNEGVVTTTTTNPAADVIFANVPSKYRGGGTMYDVDVAVTSSNLTLENSLNTRSLIVSTTGTVDISTHTLSINKNLTKTSGTLNVSNGTLRFIRACVSCVDLTSNADVTLNANQTFGNVFVAKPNGVKVSLMSNVTHSFTAPKTLTIQSGILDANANTVNGTGHLTMTGGELQLAKNSTALPELTGTYTLTAGKITLDGGAQIVKSKGDINTNYYDLEFAGTGIKTFNSNNVNVNNRLFLSLPTTTGNYVNTDTDTLYVLNSDPDAITRTGGHIVGYLGRNITASNIYRFYVGSTNSGGDTYYEPITITTNALLGTNALVAKFYDATPNPIAVNNVTFLTTGGNSETVQAVETEGYWHVTNTQNLAGGNYTASVDPSSLWTFTKPWAQDYYVLLKQDTEAQPWDFTNGGIRENDSTTTAFSNFSNFALAFADSVFVLSVKLLQFTGEKTNKGNHLYWTTAQEVNNDFFELQRAADALSFVPIGKVRSKGESMTPQHYQYLDAQPINGWNYYRLRIVDKNGADEFSSTIAIYNHKAEAGVVLLPNPAHQEVVFDFVGADPNSDLQVEIMDVNGRSLFRQQYPVHNTRIQQSISTEQLASGVYFVRFQNGETNKTLKLVVRH